MKYKQLTASLLAIVIGGTILGQSYHTAIAASEVGDINSEQRQVARQVSALLDRSHYLDKPLDKETGKQILANYFDNLDPNHNLFLQSDIDEFTKKYADRVQNRYLLYTKDVRKDGTLLCLPVYMTLFL